jgi:DNA-binding GntR family transcriptional regulator
MWDRGRADQGASTMPPRQPVSDRIVADIRADIRAGRLRTGDRLPSMSELRERYDCSDTPVKAAMRTLHAMGLTEGHQGKGWYVASPPISEEQP